MGRGRLGGIAGTIVLIVIITTWRLHNRSADSEEVKAEAIKVLSLMEGFEENKELLLKMADRAHTIAFDQSYEMGRRFRRSQFDDDKYVDAFFRAMIREADIRNRQDLKKSLLALRASGDVPSGAGPEPASAGVTGSRPEAEKHLPEKGGSRAPGDARFVRADIEALPDNKLTEAIFDRLSNSVTGLSQQEEVAAVRKMSAGQRMVYLTWRFEAEVNNGGLDQYFSNGPGRMAKDAVVAYKLIGAKENTKLVRRAIAAYMRQYPEQKFFKEDKTIKGYMKKYKDCDLGKLDSEFFESKENIDKLRTQYIRAHLGEFVKA